MAKLVQTYPNISLSVIGEQKRGGHTERLISKLNLKERIKFFSNLNQDDLVRSINNYMSENEGFYIIGSYFDGLSVSDCIQKGKKISEII